MTTSLGLPTTLPGDNGKSATHNTQATKLDEAITDETSLDFTSGNITLTDAQFRAVFAFLATNVSVARTLDLDVTTTAIKRFFLVTSSSGNSATLTVNRGTTNIDVAPGESKLFYVDGTANGLREMTAASGGVSLLSLTDVDPSSYSGQAKKLVMVNKTPDGIDFQGPVGGMFFGAVIETRNDHDDPDADTDIHLNHISGGFFDDGIPFGLVENLVLDTTTTGAGALDTGTIASDKPYELYLIQRDDTKAFALLGSKAADTVNDVSHTTGSTNSILNGSTTNTDLLAQSWTPGVTAPLHSVILRLNKQGSPTTFQAWVTIEADSSGDPSGTPLATSYKIEGVNVDTSNIDLMFVFPEMASLTASTTYWIVLHANNTQSDTAGLRWVGNTSSTYANGLAKAFNGATWSTTVDGSVLDFIFQTQMANGGSNPSMPANYTQKLRIGYFCTNNASDIVPYQQIDKKVLYHGDTQRISFTNVTTLQTFDLNPIVPPIIKSVIHLDVEINVAGANFNFGCPPYGHAFRISTPTHSEHGLRRIMSTNDGFHNLHVGPLQNHGNRLYFDQAAGTTSAGAITVLGYDFSH